MRKWNENLLKLQNYRSGGVVASPGLKCPETPVSFVKEFSETLTSIVLRPHNDTSPSSVQESKVHLEFTLVIRETISQEYGQRSLITRA